MSNKKTIVQLIRDEIRPVRLVGPVTSVVIYAGLLCRYYVAQSLGLCPPPLISVIYYAMLSGVVIADFAGRHFARKDLYISDHLDTHLRTDRAKGPWFFVAVDMAVFLVTVAVACALTLPGYMLLFASLPKFCLYIVAVVLLRTILSLTYVLRARRHLQGS